LYFSSSLSAAQPLEHEEKIYLKPNQVQIDEHGIFVDLSNQAVSVTGIHLDEFGLYVLTSEYRLDALEAIILPTGTASVMSPDAHITDE